MSIIDLTLVNAVSIHLYGRGTPEHPYPPSGGFGNVADIIHAYQALGKPLAVSEFGAPVSDFGSEHERAAYIGGVMQGLAAEDLAFAIHFCWSDAMVDGFGLLDGGGGVHESYAAFYAAADALQASDEPIMQSWPLVQVPSPNHYGRADYEPVAVVLHTMAGSLAGCDSWFTNPASQVSAHFGVGLDGTIHQYVDLEDAAWANGILEPGNRWPFGATNPNYKTVSIETEDLGDAGRAVTDDQFGATLACVRRAMAQFPSITHLVAHRVISPQSRPNCPGDRWIASGRFGDLAAEAGLYADW